MSKILCKQAKEIIHDIENSLILHIDQKHDLSYHGMLNGVYGSYLFLLQYYKYKKDHYSFDIINSKFEELLIDSLDSISTCTYASGLSGILYLLKYMQINNLVNINSDSYNSIFNKILIKETLADLSMENIDFLHGALGLTTYLLKNNQNKEFINLFIDFLFNKAIINTQKEICKWKFPFGLSSKEFTYNISLSHGMSGLLIFLYRLKKNGYMSPKIDIMIKGGVNYLVEQSFNSSKFKSLFPRLSKEVYDEESRLGWCYGDLGVAYAIFLSSKVIGDKSLEDLSIDYLTRTTKRLTYTQTDVIDASICHGSAGLYMFYNRLYIETKLPIFYQSALYWIEKTINFSTFSDGVAGYKSYINNNWKCDYDLLTGIPGIGLSLLSYIRRDSQSWDELFLLSYDVNPNENALK